MTVLDLAVFLDELGLLAVLAIGGASVTTAALRLPVAIALPVLTVALWGVWLAPKAQRRLDRRSSAAAKLALFTAAAGLLLVTRSVPWAVVFWVVSVPLILYSERPGRLSYRRSH